MVKGEGLKLKHKDKLNKAYKVFLDDNRIINIVSLKVIKDPELNTHLAELIELEVNSILNKNPGNTFHLIVDLSSIGKGGYASSKARKIYNRISANSQINKFSIVGGSVFARTIAGFIIRAAGKGGNMQWFATRDECLNWLRN